MNSSADVLVIGGGAIGLATAIELAGQGIQVTVLNRDMREAALPAAAGMLAPQAEELPPGPLLDLCLQSRDLYPQWTAKLTSLTGLETGYWPCGIVTPCFAEDLALAQQGRGGEWCDRTALHHLQPDLHPQVIGGKWFPQDAQVNNQQLTQVLQRAAQQLGVNLQEGVTVESFGLHKNHVQQVNTNVGPWQAQTYLLSTGAWSGQLLPIPVRPRKGQLFSVQALGSPEQPQPLGHILFGSQVYIVPRQTGRIVVGATSEDVEFAPHNTPAGIQSLLAAAMRLYPPLQGFALENFWWGFRPTTPDELPILGMSPYDNLVLATGHYRNGILLAPVTAQLITQLILTRQQAPNLDAFSWQRWSEGVKPQTTNISTTTNFT